jgi:ATP-dependent DNA ligase
MEARPIEAIPIGEEWQYEPKWDGFRYLLAREAGDVAMYSKSGQDLGRYFPEVVAAALNLRETRFTIDGELVMPMAGHFSFDDLLQRIHSCQPHQKLAEKTPAVYLAFDLLRRGKTELDTEPLAKRRPLLEKFAIARLQFEAFPLLGIPPPHIETQENQRVGIGLEQYRSA